LTYIFNNYKEELMSRNNGSIVISKDLKDLIRHTVVDYYLLSFLKEFLLSGFFRNFEGFVYTLDSQLFTPRQETLSQLYSKDNIIYIYYNTTLRSEEHT